ncbi:MAG: diguanylate cyclase [Candidatus Limnocylindrales bacterium]
MNHPDIARLLDELARAVAADAGLGLFLADTEDALGLVATHPVDAHERSGGSWLSRAVGRPAVGRRPRLGLQRGGDDDPREQLLMVIPDGRGGVLVMGRRDGEPFSAQDRAIARLYARQLAVELTGTAVERAVGPAGPAWRAQLQLVQSIASRLTRLTTIERIGEAICAETRRVVPYDNARVYVLAPDGVTLEAVAFSHHATEYAGETADGLRLRLGQGITGSIVETGQAVVVADAQHHPAAIPVPGTELIQEALLVVPLVYEGMPRGAIVLCRLGREAFRQDELRLIQVLADQAVVAVENARSLALRDRMLHELQALLEISRAGADEHDERELAGLVGDIVLRTSRADAAVISRWDESSALLEVLGQVGHLGGSVDRSRVDMTGLPRLRQVLLEGTPHLVRSRSSRVDSGAQGLLRRMGARQVLLLPLVASGRTIGLLELYLVSDERVVTAREVEVYGTMASHAAAALQNVRLMRQLREAADIDQLTGIHNNRYLQDRLNQEVARSMRTDTPLSVLLLDLDGFKTINDEHGHADGDRVLQNVAATLRLAVRANDIVARYGGDEFVVVMPETDLEAARQVADRVVASVRAVRHPLSDGSEGVVACSAGLALFPTDGRTASRLLRSADAAMYRIKRGGGDALGRAEHPRADGVPHADVPARLPIKRLARAG